MKRPIPKYLVLSEEAFNEGLGRMPIGPSLRNLSVHKSKATAIAVAKRRARYGDRMYVVKVIGYTEQEIPPVKYVDWGKSC
jgi:hypothetical protein